jgi:DNA (cytosine-5)-methyltransferase 1
MNKNAKARPSIIRNGKQNKLTAIDLFAGAGGFSYAARSLGAIVIAAVEMDLNSCTTYHKNFITKQNNQPKLYDQDINDLQPKTILSDLHLSPGDLDILIGGPPCQGYSAHRINGTGINDERNKLLLTYSRFLKELRPKFFLVENVPGLLWPRHAEFLNRFVKTCRRNGYNVSRPTILNARDYGVPQNRRRVFIYGQRSDIKKSIAWPPLPTHFSPKSKDVEREGKQAWEIAAEVFRRKISKNDSNAIHMNHSQELVLVFKSTPKNGGSRRESNRELSCHENHDGHKDVYGRINPNVPGPTMTTACINPSKGRFVHPTRNHGITSRHAARFQDFPDSFVFYGGLMSIGKQIGNAVPIRLGRAVLEPIISAMIS